jgi:hypothetical protein
MFPPSSVSLFSALSSAIDSTPTAECSDASTSAFIVPSLSLYARELDSCET